MLTPRHCAEAVLPRLRAGRKTDRQRGKKEWGMRKVEAASKRVSVLLLGWEDIVLKLLHSPSLLSKAEN